MKRFAWSIRRAAPAAFVASSFAISLSALAQAYPTKPIHVVVPWAAGASADIAARVLSSTLAGPLAQPLIVENRVGASESIAAETVARAAPDGYTLLICSANALAFRPFLAKVVPYDSVKDFTPITKVADTAGVIVVSRSVPVNSLKELLDYAKANRGKIAYGTTGIGTSSHLAAEQIQQITGVTMLHVPYKSGVQLLNEVISGVIPVSYLIMGTLAPQVKSDKIRAIAIIGDNRERRIPDVPTITETLSSFKAPPAWVGVLGPAGLPDQLVRRLNAEFIKGVNQPEVRAKLEQLVLNVVGSSPEDFGSMIKRDLDLVGRIVKAAGIQPTD